jgi:hypothetical protein
MQIYFMPIRIHRTGKNLKPLKKRVGWNQFRSSVIRIRGSRSEFVPKRVYTEHSLKPVLLSGGHASVNGCVAGAVLGVACGFSSLPSHWIQRNRFPPITSRYICSSLTNIFPARIKITSRYKITEIISRGKKLLLFCFICFKLVLL